MRSLLETSYRAAVAAADPLEILPAHLPAPPRGRTFVAAVGKAAASMALAVERRWPATAPLEGIALTRYGHGLPLQRIRVVEAGHPVPDAAGAAAARSILDGARSLGPDDLLLALISGGGSALLSVPSAGLTLDALKALTSDLLRCGAPIEEINAVRKHLSAVHGGRLAAATRARVLALIVSDVTGDDPTHIASGPCTPDPTTCAEARAVLAKYGIVAPGAFEESPKPGDPLFDKVENRVIATAHRSLEAAAGVFRRADIEPVILGDSIVGEAAEVAKVMAALSREVRQHASPWRPPVALISGGECTVTMPRGGGRGGRCGEFLLGFAVALGDLRGTWAIAADTDGIDGSEDNAGAVLSPDTLARGAGSGLEARQFLANHDSYGYFSALGDLLTTGPTRTNVNDYRAIILLP